MRVNSPDIAPFVTSCSTAAVAAAADDLPLVLKPPAIPSSAGLRRPAGEREGGGTFQESEVVMSPTSFRLVRRQRPSLGANMSARSCSASLLSASRSDSDRQCCRMTCWNSCGAKCERQQEGWRRKRLG